MTTQREGIFVSGLWVEKEPLSAPKVDEVGLTSAPLQSMAFYFGDFCKRYNDDFIQCKNENTDPRHCLLEGRKVTRCALDLITKLKDGCQQEWTNHYECLDANNQIYSKCRSLEKVFGDCVFNKFGIKKTIPGAEGDVPIHLKENPIFK